MEAFNHPAIKQYIGRVLGKYNSPDNRFDEAEVSATTNAVVKGVLAASKRQIRTEDAQMKAKWFTGQDTRRRPGETIGAWESRMTSEFLNRAVKADQAITGALFSAIMPNAARANEIADHLNKQFGERYKPKTKEQLLESYMRGE
jgi:hypothetical protein